MIDKYIYLKKREFKVMVINSIKYQQNKQSALILTHWTQIRPQHMILERLGQAQKCGRVKLFTFVWKIDF